MASRRLVQPATRIMVKHEGIAVECMLAVGKVASAGPNKLPQVNTDAGTRSHIGSRSRAKVQSANLQHNYSTHEPQGKSAKESQGRVRVQL